MASIITVLQLSIFKLSGLNLFNFSLFGLFFCLITFILKLGDQTKEETKKRKVKQIKSRKFKDR